MTKAEQYRERAAELRTRAKNEASPMIRSEWENLAKAYIHLAEQADRNSRLEMGYEPPPQPPGHSHPQQHTQQQQQTQQPKIERDEN